MFGNNVLRSAIKFCADAGENPAFSVGYKVSVDIDPYSPIKMRTGTIKIRTGIGVHGGYVQFFV